MMFARVPQRSLPARIRLITVALCLLAFGQAMPVASQSLTTNERDRGRIMLTNIKNEIKKSYYDSNFHGIDLEARFKAASDKIDNATSVGQVFGIVAQVLLEFEDSHLFFIPPQMSYSVDYGWQMQIIGDQCYVSEV